MKATLLALALFATSARAADSAGTFGLHLFFDEKEFVDVLTVSRTGAGALHAHMSVPNDFEGDINVISEQGNTLVFDLPVPKNASRPDLLFHYDGRFFDDSKKQLTGFVTMNGEFVASFVAFRRASAAK
ncbi:MAG: hypothetical protein ACXVB9_21610 [Bdellovibrionota bacterium]